MISSFCPPFEDQRGSQSRTNDLDEGPGRIAPTPTPSSHSKNSLSKICSKGWVAQTPFV